MLCECRRPMVMTFVKRISFTEDDGGIMGVIIMAEQVVAGNIVHLRFQNSSALLDWP